MARPAEGSFLLWQKALAARFRNRLDIALKTLHPELHRALSAGARRARAPSPVWVVDRLHVGHGRHALRYLARYVFKTILSSGRLLGYTPDGRIQLAYQNSTTKQWGVTSLRTDTFPIAL